MSEERNRAGAVSGSDSDLLDSTFQLISRVRDGDQEAVE